MKKEIIITLKDGSTERPEWNKVMGSFGTPSMTGQLIGAPADHPAYMQLIAGIGVAGFFHDDSNATYLRFVPPSAIEKIEIIFTQEAADTNKLFLSKEAHD